MDIQIDMEVDIAIDTKITCNSNGYPYRYQGDIDTESNSNKYDASPLFSQSFPGSAARIEFDSAGWVGGLQLQLHGINQLPTATFLLSYCYLPSYLSDDD